MIAKVKNTVPSTYVINGYKYDSNGEEIIRTFYELKENCKKQIKMSLELKKYSRNKVINYMLNGKDAIFRLIVG